MFGTMIAAVLLGTGPIAVDVGKADWDALPPLESVDRRLPTSSMVGQVEAILKSGECDLPGQNSRRFDITVPYAVLVEPDGSARRVVVAESGCAPLESYVGLVVLNMAEMGDFLPTRQSKARWYASELNFNQQ